jgi:protoheme IX farnesyltransferase
MKQILIYTIALVAVTLSLYWVHAGWFYLIIAILFGAEFIKKSYQAKKDQTVKRFRGLFGYSIVYLFILFFALIIESSVTYWFFS